MLLQAYKKLHKDSLSLSVCCTYVQHKSLNSSLDNVYLATTKRIPESQPRGGVKSTIGLMHPPKRNTDLRQRV